MLRSVWSSQKIVNKSSLTLSWCHHRKASTLVIAEPLLENHDKNTTLLTSATLSAITAAQNIQHKSPSKDGTSGITLLTFSPIAVDSAAKSNIPPCISTILVPQQKLSSSTLVAETLTDIIISAQEKYQFTHIITPSSKFGSNILPRAAAKLRASPISDVIAVVDANTYVRPMYAGNILVTVKHEDTVPPSIPQMLTIRGTAFEKAKGDEGTPRNVPLQIETLNITSHTDPKKTTFVSANVSKSNRPDLSSASIVVRQWKDICINKNNEFYNHFLVIGLY